MQQRRLSNLQKMVDETNRMILIIDPTLTNKSDVSPAPDNDEDVQSRPQHKHSLTEDVMPEHEETFVDFARQRSSTYVFSQLKNIPIQCSQQLTLSPSTPSTLLTRMTLNKVQDCQLYPRSARIRNGSIYEELLEKGSSEEVAYKRQRIYNILSDVLGSNGDEMEKGTTSRR
jgi:hypothetical protein